MGNDHQRNLTSEKSVTEQGDLEEFLSTAALADTKFVSGNVAPIIR